MFGGPNPPSCGGPARSAIAGTLPAPGAARLLLGYNGQSNARASGTAGQNPPGNWSTMGANARIWTGAFSTYDWTTNADRPSQAGNFAAEGEFMRLWLAANAGGTAYCIKYAVNGTDLGSQWQPVTGIQWSAANSDYSAAKAAISASAIDVLIWHQYEADVVVQSYTDNYGTNMATLIADIRSRWGSSTTKVIAVAPNDTQHSVAQDKINSQSIKRQMFALAASDPNFFVVSINDVTPNNVHFSDPNVFVTIGQRAWAAYTSGLDATPNAFTVTDTTGAATSTLINSGSVRITGITTGAPVSVSAGEFRIIEQDGTTVARDWASTPSYVDLNQYIQLRITSSASNNATVSVVLTVGGVSDQWDVTTSAAPSYANAETTGYRDRVLALGGGSYSGAQLTAIDAFYTAIKAAGLYSSQGSGNAIKRFFLFGNIDEVAARLDFIDYANNSATKNNPNNALTWSTTNGYQNPTANGGNNIDLNIDGSTCSQNGAGIGVYLKTESANAGLDIGQSSALSPRITARRTQSAGVTNVRWLINVSTNINKTTGLVNGPGFFHVQRSASNLVTLYDPTGATDDSDATASSPPSSGNIGVPALGGATDRAYTAAWVTDVNGVTGIDAKVQAFRNAVVALVTAFGAN